MGREYQPDPEFEKRDTAADVSEAEGKRGQNRLGSLRVFQEPVSVFFWGGP